jgi:uncharacterized phage protein (TIGR01671 family)
MKMKFRAWMGNDKVPGSNEFMIYSENFRSLSKFFYEFESRLGNAKFLMQSTRLKDKNGTEIYEGDIVKAAIQGQHTVCEVKWGKGRCGLFLYRERGGIVWNLSGGGPDNDEESVEIIGNVYETPGLCS